MDCDINRIGAELAGKFRMDIDQTKKEINYKVSLKLLENLKYKGIISDMEYAQIDKLNRQSFSPVLDKVYV